MLSTVEPLKNQLRIYLSKENYSTDKLMLSENIISAKIVYKRYFSNGMEKLVKKLNEINQLKEIQLINQEHLFNRDPTDWDSDIKTIIDMVNANSSISSLTLEYFNISFDAIKDINLAGCAIDKETITSLMEVTKDNKNLEKINLIRNGDYNNNLSTLKAILAALANNIALKELNLIEETILDNYLYLSSEEHASHFNKINELVTNNASIHAALSKTHFAENNHIQDLLNVKTAISAEGMQKINHVIVRSMHSLQDLCLNAVHKAIQTEKIPLKVTETRLPAELFNQVNPNVDKRETKFKFTKFNLFQSPALEQSSTKEKTIYWKLGKLN